MEFNLLGQGDNFLHVTMSKGEELSCESNAMVMMEGTLDLVGEMKGGFFSAVGRKLANGESFFTQSIRATRGPGDVLLSPTIPGDIHVLHCGRDKQFFVNDGAFLAAEAGVQLRMRMQSVGRALFGGSGGFFVGQSAGTGKLAVSGFGTVFELHVDTTADNPITIDNNHVVAWEQHLTYDLALRTNKSAGLLSSIVNSAISGEGVVLKFYGRGDVLICSRNRADFVSWLGSQIGPRR